MREFLLTDWRSQCAAMVASKSSTFFVVSAIVKGDQ
jgi:hypothetical protein